MLLVTDSMCKLFAHNPVIGTSCYDNYAHRRCSNPPSNDIRNSKRSIIDNTNTYLAVVAVSLYVTILLLFQNIPLYRPYQGKEFHAVCVRQIATLYAFYEKKIVV